jgi:membrane protein implicated in regulation of membrane protease activity
MTVVDVMAVVTAAIMALSMVPATVMATGVMAPAVVAAAMMTPAMMAATVMAAVVAPAMVPTAVLGNGRARKHESRDNRGDQGELAKHGVSSNGTPLPRATPTTRHSH